MTSIPSVRISSIRRAYDDGNHNAFTDLCRFKGRYYLSFRNCPEGHMLFTSSKGMVMSSEDGREWRKEFEWSVPGRDTRDPHMCVLGDRLFAYSGTWLCEEHPTINNHLGYGVWTDDGRSWHGPVALEGTYGHYVWRAASTGGKVYLNGRRVKEFWPGEDKEERMKRTQSVLLESDDGLVFRTCGVIQENWGDETAVLFEEDGSALAVARSLSRGEEWLPAQVCRSKPPYREWSRVDLDRYIGGPMLVKWNGNYLVGGRKNLTKKHPTTSIYWLVDDVLHEIAELPSGGDNSYPGFVQTSQTTALLSWYSSHEGSGTKTGPCSIYLANLELV